MDSIWITLILAGVLVTFFVLFKEELAKRISGSEKIEFGIGDFKIRLESSGAQRVLQSLLEEKKVLIDKVPPAERQRVIPAIENRDGNIRVEEIFKNFIRDSKQHDYLRDLRDAQFIRPVEGGRFQADKMLQLKPFGRLMLQYQRAYILTGKSA